MREKEDVSIGLGDLESEVSEEDSVVLGVGRCVKVNLRSIIKKELKLTGFGQTATITYNP